MYDIISVVITALVGENSFEINRELERIAVSFGGVAERVDGTELELRRLPDLFMGSTLFADKRLVIIKNMSENKNIWGVFGEWLARISDDVHVVLVDERPDKRTKTYKELQKLTTIREFKVWSERDTNHAEKWASEEAARLGFELDAKNARLLVMRVGVDQWLLYQALQKLRVLDQVTSEDIELVIESNPIENVFNLFDAALKGDIAHVKEMVETLQLSEDPYRLFGLLSNQAFQLLALGLSGQSSAEVAKDIGAHPFALSKLSSHSKRLEKTGVKKVFTLFVEADTAMKTSAADPWILIERTLVKTATI